MSAPTPCGGVRKPPDPRPPRPGSAALHSWRRPSTLRRRPSTLRSLPDPRLHLGGRGDAPIDCLRRRVEGVLLGLVWPSTQKLDPVVAGGKSKVSKTVRRSPTVRAIDQPLTRPRSRRTVRSNTQADRCRSSSVRAARIITCAPLPRWVRATSCPVICANGDKPFLDLLYEWDIADTTAGNLGDGRAAQELAFGGVAGHVFERPGTYGVRLTVATATRTVCVSASGNFAGCFNTSERRTTGESYSVGATPSRRPLPPMCTSTQRLGVLPQRLRGLLVSERPLWRSLQASSF